MRDVFVSFSVEDQGMADEAVQSLESNGFSGWIASRDIPPGMSYAAAIVQGIREAKVVVILLTAASRSSQHVLREIECAVGAQRPILTVQMPGGSPDETLTYYLGPTQWLRNETPELDVYRLLASVKK